MASDKVLVLTKENFESEVIESNIPVVVDFWAQWCNPCLAVAPIVDELAEYFEGKVKMAKLNIDDEGEITEKFMVMSIPTMIIFKDGEVFDKRVGAHTKDDFIDFINKCL